MGNTILRSIPAALALLGWMSSMAPDAVACSLDMECDDGDACSVDRCDAGSCTSLPVSIDDVRQELVGFPSGCPSIPAVERRRRRAADLLTRAAGAATSERAGRLMRRAAGQVERARGRLERVCEHDRLSRPCCDAARDADLVLTAHLACLLRPVGGICGGIADPSCPEGEFCELPTGQCCCDIRGTCVARTCACPRNVRPVCGCDRVTYPNDCARRGAGVALARDGRCR